MHRLTNFSGLICTVKLLYIYFSVNIILFFYKEYFYFYYVL